MQGLFMAENFFNKRIEGPFKETYKGFNQYLYTGEYVDDLFLMDSSDFGMCPRLCRIEEAFLEYGKKEKYDLVITVGEDQKLSFANPDQEGLFNGLAKGSSERLVENGRKAKTFVSRQRNRNENNAASGSNAVNDNSADASAANGQGSVQGAAQNPTQQVEGEARGNDGLNRLNRVTRVLKQYKFKTLVIYPYPEKMIVGGTADAPTLERLEVIVKKWRDIIQEANPATRTVLIVNPHRLSEFRTVEKTLSCYDHNCKQILLGQPPIDEMKAWLKKYKGENNIQGTHNEYERVVLTGRANVGGSLQNFISWVQGFYSTQQGMCRWNDLLLHEN